MHKSKNIVHINTKAKRSQTSYLQEVWPFYSLTSVKDGILSDFLGNIKLGYFLQVYLSENTYVITIVRNESQNISPQYQKSVMQFLEYKPTLSKMNYISLIYHFLQFSSFDKISPCFYMRDLEHRRYIEGVVCPHVPLRVFF